MRIVATPAFSASRCVLIGMDRGDPGADFPEHGQRRRRRHCTLKKPPWWFESTNRFVFDRRTNVTLSVRRRDEHGAACKLTSAPRGRRCDVGRRPTRGVVAPSRIMTVVPWFFRIRRLPAYFASRGRRRSSVLGAESTKNVRRASIRLRPHATRFGMIPKHADAVTALLQTSDRFAFAFGVERASEISMTAADATHRDQDGHWPQERSTRFNRVEHTSLTRPSLTHDRRLRRGIHDRSASDQRLALDPIEHASRRVPTEIRAIGPTPRRPGDCS